MTCDLRLSPTSPLRGGSLIVQALFVCLGIYRLLSADTSSVPRNTSLDNRKSGPSAPDNQTVTRRGGFKRSELEPLFKMLQLIQLQVIVLLKLFLVLQLESPSRSISTTHKGTSRWIYPIASHSRSFVSFELMNRLPNIFQNGFERLVFKCTTFYQSMERLDVLQKTSTSSSSTASVIDSSSSLSITVPASWSPWLDYPIHI